jgi:Copper type II ascorbate-dependent monooxygenase, C-terminal domain
MPLVPDYLLWLRSRRMKSSPLMLAVSAAGRFVPSLACLLAVALYAGCSDDDEDPVSRSDAAASAGSDAAASDGGARDASAPADAAAPAPDAASPADAAASDASQPPPMDAQAPMDAAMDAAMDAGGDSDVAAADGATDGAAADGGATDASDAASDAAQDTGTSDSGGGDAGNGWPVQGCDQSYRFVARSGSGGRFSVPQGDTYEIFRYNAPWNNQEVQAVAFRPVLDNERVVKRMRLEVASNFQVLTHFAAGDEQPVVLPSNMGMAMPSGPDSLLLVVRYINDTGGTRTDQSGVDVCIVRSPRLRSVRVAHTDQFFSSPPVIEAGASNVEVTTVCNVDNVQPVYLMSANPYAHEYGVWAKFTVIKQNGTEIVMHHQAYDFDNRNVFYPLANEVMIEQGDQVKTTCVFTNPSNEDLPIGGGGDISEGLCINHALYHPAPPGGVLRCIPEP